MIIFRLFEKMCFIKENILTTNLFNQRITFNQVHYLPHLGPLRVTEIPVNVEMEG